MIAPDVGRASRCTLVRFPSVVPARRRLFCFPYAGGGPSTYRRWPAILPQDVEVVAVVLPGRDPRTRLAGGEQPPGAMHAVVPAVLDEIVRYHASDPLPFAIFGHSLGALVAYEVTIGLEANGRALPEHLFVSGRRPPDEAHTGAVVHALPQDEFLDRMQERYGGVPDAVRNEPDLLALFLPALRADVELFETYEPRPGGAVRCPVRVYGGDRDRKPHPDELGGWQRSAERTISIRLFPGGHFFLDDERDALVSDIARQWTSVVRDGTTGRAGVA